MVSLLWQLKLNPLTRTQENVKESEDATEAFLGMVEQETARLRALGAA